MFQRFNKFCDRHEFAVMCVGITFYVTSPFTFVLFMALIGVW